MRNNIHKGYNRQQGIGVLLIIAIVAVVGLAGAGAYVATKGDVAVETNTNTSENSNISGEGSIRAIFAMGENLRCTFLSAHATGKTEGVVYVADRGERTRGDFRTETTSTAAVESHFIKQGTTGYMWSSSMQQGIKMEIPEGQDAPVSSEATQNQQSIDFDTNVSYDCERWNVDESQFQVPTNIQFMSITDMMKNIPGAGANVNVNTGVNAGVNTPAAGTGAGAGASGSASIKAAQCSACDSAPTESAKTQCKAALGC